MSEKRFTVDRDWTDPSSYGFANTIVRDGWAWEFLRRNPSFQADWQDNGGGSAPSIGASPRDNVKLRSMRCSNNAAEGWGLVDFPHADGNAEYAKTDVFWLPECCASVLHATVVRSAWDPQEDGLVIPQLPGLKTILRTPHGVQHVLVRQDWRGIHFTCEGGDVLRDNVFLQFRLDGFRRCRKALVTYLRLKSLRNLGRFASSLFKQDPRARQLTQALRALDADRAKAPRRQIAIALFGKRLVDEEWKERGGRLKKRTRYALMRGRALMRRDYLRLLG